MSRATEGRIASISLRGGAGALAGWECAPPPGVAGRGTVVLVPGFTGSKEDFAAMLPILADAGFRCVAYDQRGQFESDGPDDPARYGIDDFAGDLLGIVEGLGAPVHLVGHSFGGYVARTAVVARPELFGSLTLLASGPSSVEDIAFPSPTRVEQMIEAGGQDVVWQMLAEAGAAAHPDEAKRQFLHRRIHATKKANLVGIVRAMRTRPVAPALVRAAGIPILVGYGDTGDLWAPEIHADFARQLGARVAVYPGVGHLPNEERPQRVCADLVAFWNGIEP
ncbi:alpha/beta hydrolase [Nocardia sp. CDC159]|uniref:Alpha/beta hydrolase n=1 Tax=Nocardia pulmonis TaxID=2951408 RepID=A0A9X2IWZ8_9NOCA|nr:MULTISPECIES: alpha/beta hydrolase [Nocardia]MCM6772391.1 alpha/beta hydrolase [Nocardia pulmonis]MCM6784951.1 alpha/beta hydrolase [Nocardia sp. CDC159]